MAQDSKDNDKRHFTRIAFDATASISKADTNWSASLIDISLKGMLIERPENLGVKIGDTCSIQLRLNDSDVVISMEGKVAHIEEDSVGFGYENIGIDSITHLRRLVELNLGDSNLLNRELAELMAARK